MSPFLLCHLFFLFLRGISSLDQPFLGFWRAVPLPDFGNELTVADFKSGHQMEYGVPSFPLLLARKCFYFLRNFGGPIFFCPYLIQWESPLVLHGFFASEFLVCLLTGSVSNILQALT